MLDNVGVVVYNKRVLTLKLLGTDVKFKRLFIYFGMENTVNYINQRGGNAIFYKIPGANHVGTRKAAFETSKLLEWILEKMN